MDQANPEPTRKVVPRRVRLIGNHIRYAIMNVFMVAGMATMGQGGVWTWFGLLFTFVLLGFVDELFGDDDDKGAMPHPLYLNAMLWLTLPFLVILTLLAINISTDGYPLIDAGMRMFGLDADVARQRTDFWAAEGAFVSLGMYYGAAGINVAHELIHRSNPAHYIVGRWLLAFSWDTQFAIAHVHEHHRNVATEIDSATARRGEYVFAFVVRSAIGQHRFAREFERNRLKNKPFPQRLVLNRFWRGQLMSLVIVAGFVWLAGPLGLVWSAFSAAIGKIYLEVVNYIEHYGLVRVPGTRVEPRHSWDSYRWLSTGMFYNLQLHSYHHRFATRPFWDLRHAHGAAPMLPMGYMPMILTSMVPPLWNPMSKRLLANWDRTFASDAERELLRERGQLVE